MVFSISELAERTGTSQDTLRYYGRLGLLPESGRTAAGHRYYDEAAVERLRFIKGAQWLDLQLGEIGELLAVLDGDGCPCGFTEELVRRRIAEIDRQRARLEEMRTLLARLLGETPENAAPAAAARPAAGVPVGEANASRVAAASGETGCECGCCQPAEAASTEHRIVELQARRAAVERRLQGVVGTPTPR